MLHKKPVVLLVKVWYRPVFTCADCGRSEVGRGSDASSDTFEGLEQVMRPVPSLMPVGWASYGIYMYRCPAHKK